MEYVAVVILLALLQYVVFGALVAAPAAVRSEGSGRDRARDLERYFRAHYNTLELLVAFVPAIWLFATYVSPSWPRGSASCTRRTRALLRAMSRIPRSGRSASASVCCRSSC